MEPELPLVRCWRFCQELVLLCLDEMPSMSKTSLTPLGTSKEILSKASSWCRVDVALGVRSEAFRMPAANPGLVTTPTSWPQSVTKAY
jgi:hypothetical protein